MMEYKIPLDIFNCETTALVVDEVWIEEKKAQIKKVMEKFDIEGEVFLVGVGPRVTTFGINLPKTGSPRRLLNLDMDFALALGVGELRCYPDFTDATICLEVPNKVKTPVSLGELLSMDEMQAEQEGKLRIAMGKDMKNEPVFEDLTKMVHTLVAGSSGSGKSCFLNAVLASLLYKYSPKELQMILIDPKRVEFALFDGAPHLLAKPLTDLREAIAALGWAIGEMDRRYHLFQQMSMDGTYVVNLDQYNQAVKDEKKKLPKLVIVIDELADLMLVDRKNVEGRLQTLAQKSRAAGIHLIVASQRPSVDVLTGVIKANFPTRVAFKVPAAVDSRIILDNMGAQTLLGYGDCLYSKMGMALHRVQVPFVSMEEIKRLVAYVKKYYTDTEKQPMQFVETEIEAQESEIDASYIEALRVVVELGAASISTIQRKCSMGYNKAGRIIEWMEEKGYISPFDGVKARQVFITKEEFEKTFGK